MTPPPHTPAIPRSLWALALLAAGFILARNTGPAIPSTLWFSLAAAACAVAALSRAHACRIALAAAALLFGAGWWAIRITEPAAHWLPRLAGDGPALVCIEGVVLEEPRRTERERSPLDVPLAEQPHWRTTIDVAALIGDHDEVTPARGILRLSGGNGDSAHLKPGQRARILGEFEATAPPRNPGEPDRRTRDAQEGIAGDLRVIDLASARGLPTEGTLAHLRARSLSARAAMRSAARRLVLGPDEPASALPRPAREARALLGALILGEDDPALSDLRGAFQRFGLVHILSISGFHLMVMALLALAVVRLAGDLGWVEPLVVGAIVTAYLIVLPFNAPVWRAGLMLLGLLLGDSLGRRYDRLGALAWIAAALLLWRPADAWSIGFQLSFGLVAVLMRFGPVAHERLWGITLKGTLDRVPVGWRAARAAAIRHAKTLVAVNILCAAASAPLVLYHTGLVSPVSILAGLVALLPIVLLMIAAYAGLLVGLLAPPLAGIASSLLGALASASAATVRALDHIPGGALRAPPVSLAWALAATALILYWFARGHWRHTGVWALAAILALWFAAEATLGPRLASPAPLRIDTLAVGDGTCHLLRSGREAILWDCGSLTPGIGRITVPRALRALGAWRIPTVVITHPNLDHFNGILDILEPLAVREVVIGRGFADAASNGRSAEAFFLHELERRHVRARTVNAGDTLALGPATLEFLSPAPTDHFQEDNNMSLVARLTHPRTTGPLLLCGDIQDAAIQSLRDRYPALHPVAMEAPHHGSGRPAAIDWVRSLAPQVIIQSTGPSRASDPRWAPVRNDPAVRWLCTAQDGALWVELRPTGPSAGRSTP